MEVRVFFWAEKNTAAPQGAVFVLGQKRFELRFSSSAF
jgi:hypothetical protein